MAGAACGQSKADAAAASAEARHEVLRLVRMRADGHLRALMVARRAEAWCRLRELADGLSAIACCAEMVEAEAAGDAELVAELQALVLRRARAA